MALQECEWNDSLARSHKNVNLSFTPLFNWSMWKQSLNSIQFAQWTLRDIVSTSADQQGYSRGCTRTVHSDIYLKL